MKSKRCYICKQIKSVDDFYKRYKDTDLLHPCCKECANSRYKAYSEKIKNSPATIIRKSKVCQRCLLEKPISQFGVQNAKPDKHLSYCKPCWTIYVTLAKQKAKRENKT